VNPPSPLLARYLEPLRECAQGYPVLDLACGSGRNGRFLVENDIPTVFSDRNPGDLKSIEADLDREQFRAKKHLARFWEVDFEQADESPLANIQCGAILVFRYLHRPLMESIKRATTPGGLVIYETFTTGQAQLGRPKNPAFLLEQHELEAHFSAWTVLHRFEGLLKSANSDKFSAMAQLVARKPLA
jgi:tellurite methyltransferase